MPPLPPEILAELIRDYLPALIAFVFFWFVLPRAVDQVGQYNAHRMQLQTVSLQSNMTFAERLFESGEKEQERHLASEEGFRKAIDALTHEVQGLRQDFHNWIATQKESK